MQRDIRLPETDTDPFVPAGGLNEVSSPLRLRSGAAREMENLYCAVDGGYTITKGVERWVYGQPAEEQAFAKIGLTSVGAASVGMWAFMQGGTSGASAWVLWSRTNTSPFTTPYLDDIGVGHVFFTFSTVNAEVVPLYVFGMKGVFQLGETVTMYALDDSTVAGTFTVSTVASDLDTTTPTTYATERLVCDKLWRLGQGYKPPYSVGASPYSIFTQPNQALENVDGQVWLLRPLVWIPDNTIRMSFNFPTNQAVQDTTTPIRKDRVFQGFWQGFTFSSPDCFPDMPTYTDTVAFNFGLSKKIYGVTGVGKAFEFDPVTHALAVISTGMTVDKPTRLAVHKNRLFLAFGRSIQWSAAADPFTWSVVVGAGEINVGDEVTMMQSVIGSDSSSALVIATRKKLFILYGDSVANFTLVNVSPEIGVHPATFQQFGIPMFMSDFGVTTLSAAQSFGNFNAATITNQIQKFINSHRNHATCSVLVRSLNQYRVFFDDRTAIYITMSGKGKPLGITVMRFPFTVLRAISLVSPIDGKELCLIITREHDRVLRMDVGRRFDDDPIDWYAILAYNHSKSPRLLKTYKKAVLEIQADSGYIQMYVGADVDFGDSYRKASPDTTVQDPNVSTSASWDAFTWDQFTFDGSPLVPVEVKIDGTGENVSLRMRNRSEMVDSFTWTGGFVQFFKRRVK